MVAYSDRDITGYGRPSVPPVGEYAESTALPQFAFTPDVHYCTSSTMCFASESISARRHVAIFLHRLNFRKCVLIFFAQPDAGIFDFEDNFLGLRGRCEE